MRSRPLLYTSYEDDQAILPTITTKVMMSLLLLVAITLPFQLVPGLRWLGEGRWLLVMDIAMIFAIGALGLNVLSGLAGQISLGHSFFMGIGAYTGIVLGSVGNEAYIGFGLPIWIWLPMAGVVAGLVGVLVAPMAVRVRGLYLAFLTIGLVFIGEHIFRNIGPIAGAPELGRDAPHLEIRLWKEANPLINFSNEGTWFGIEIGDRGKEFFFLLVLLIIFAVISKNIARTRVGRAFASIRDRDVAAEVMGVDEVRYKALAFGISSAMAGVAGILHASFFTTTTPEFWNLLLAIQFIAIILIGGLGSVSGTIMGSFFVIAIPQIVETFTDIASELAEDGAGIFGAIADFFVSTGGNDFGLVGTSAVGPGLSIFQVNNALYGVLIIVFLIFEPLGLYGIWLRVRNYWKGWPFTY